MARKCVFCSKTSVTLEHVYRRSYLRRIGASKSVDREFTQQKIGAMLLTARPENLNDCQVKRVCAKCNNGWMNRLDNAVDSWVFDPTSPPACTPLEFRRWAIKTAIVRAMVDQPDIIPTADREAIFAGRDVPVWRVFVGHTDHSEFRHAYVGSGTGEVASGMSDGIIHVSWVIGNSFTCALRTLGEGGDRVATYFDNYNFNNGWPLAEIDTSSVRFPSFELRPKLSFPMQVRSVVWFFTPERDSPIRDHMRLLRHGSTYF